MRSLGADSAITLDGQARAAIGITTYALPRRASVAAKQKALGERLPDFGYRIRRMIRPSPYSRASV